MNDEVIRAADGTPLAARLRKVELRKKVSAFLLVLPLLLFVLFTFVFPIADMPMRSVDNKIVPRTLPQTVVALAEWDSESGEIPGEAVFKALAADLKVAREDKTHTRLGSRLNYETPGISSLIRKTGRKIKKVDLDGDVTAQMLKADKRWGDIKVWTTIQRFSGPITGGYFLTAADLKLEDGKISSIDEERAIYIKLFVRTIWMSLLITLICLVIGYPVAYLLSILPMKSSNLLLILVLLPFWTSLLVRTSAWKVLLQNQGVINDVLVWFGMVADDNRLELINNMTGTLIAMTHILLPFMILPLYSVMKTIPPSYVRAAKSLGATEWTSFWRVYFPQSVPGIGAGAILVFILAIGYYITPELVGGQTGTFISNRIAYHISSSLNWGLAAALGVILLVVVVFTYWLYDRIVGIDNMKLG